MSIKKLAAALFPTTERNRLVTLTKKTFIDIEEHVLPSLQIEDKLYKDTRIYNFMDNALGRNTLGLDKYRGQPVRFLRDTVTKLLDEKEKIISFVDDFFKRDIHAEAIDYGKLEVIQYITGLVFFTEFASRATYAMTSQVINDAYKKTKTEEEYVMYCTRQENVDAFAVVVKSLTFKAKEISKAANTVKDISFSELSHDAMVRVHGSKLESLSSNYIPVIGDVAIILGEFWTTLIDYRYRLAQAQLESTKLQVLYLERSKKNATAEELTAIASQIEYYQKRVTVLEERIKDIKEDA